MLLASNVLARPEDVLLKAGVESGMHVADLGCGRSGQLTFALAREVGHEGTVYAVDVVPEVLEHLSGLVRAHGHSNIKTVWSDIETVGKTAIPENSLDRCLLHNVMSALTAHDRVLEETARLLKPRGMVLIVDYARQIGPNANFPARLLPREALRVKSERSGFELLDEMTFSDFHYGVLLRKT